MDLSIVYQVGNLFCDAVLAFWFFLALAINLTSNLFCRAFWAFPPFPPLTLALYIFATILVVAFPGLDGGYRLEIYNETMALVLDAIPGVKVLVFVATTVAAVNLPAILNGLELILAHLANDFLLAYLLALIFLVKLAALVEVILAIRIAIFFSAFAFTALLISVIGMFLVMVLYSGI
ncbi:hypothetical protein OQA88_10295 [Cercophora sp. LCS_1]